MCRKMANFHSFQVHLTQIKYSSFIAKNVIFKRSISGFAKWYRNFFKNEPIVPKPPYKHICQLGDPVLRLKATQVQPNDIKTEEIQKVIATMKKVLKRYNTVGLAAPQIGVPYRIILVEFTKENFDLFPEEIRKIRELEVCPPKILINPSIEIRNPKKVVFTEGCESVKGYSAEVARFHEVCVNGLNEQGKQVNWIAKGWLARIVQHEMDHLDGKIYTDVMDPRTFQCDHWYIVNIREGRYEIRFK